MSAIDRRAKKKLSQPELRKFMNDHKEKIQKSIKKIDSPLARYNEAGQLTCILCKSVVRSEAVWSVHINAKQHKQNVELAKKLKERTNNFTAAPKRPGTPPMEVPTKRPKGILKNAPATKIISTSNIVVISDSEKSESKNDLPPDFFDKAAVEKKDGTVVEEKMEVDGDNMKTSTLPEGFFDDPKLDAKARNVEYKDPVEEEWEKFLKEIKDADDESAAIIAEDQEDATTERQIDEIDEQLKNWSRVVDLEKKKVEVTCHKSEEPLHMEEDSGSSSDENIDEYLDWRSKKAYK